MINAHMIALGAAAATPLAVDLLHDHVFLKDVESQSERKGTIKRLSIWMAAAGIIGGAGLALFHLRAGNMATAKEFAVRGAAIAASATVGSLIVSATSPTDPPGGMPAKRRETGAGGANKLMLQQLHLPPELVTGLENAAGTAFAGMMLARGHRTLGFLIGGAIGTVAATAVTYAGLGPLSGGTTRYMS